ncbi:MAG: pyruvate kinase [Myxococcota bacterium]
MPERRIRCTKLVATIGPACRELEIIRELIRAGMNVARLNLSHADHAEHAELAARVRKAAAEEHTPVALMADTRGSEIRTGELEGGRAELAVGAAFTLRSDGAIGDAQGVSITDPYLEADLSAGAAVFLDDGRIELRVERVVPGAIACRVVRGGVLGDRKGLNAPGAKRGPSALGPDDLEDLRFAAELGVDYVAASFVRGAEDVAAIRTILGEHGAHIPVIAKIENRDAVGRLHEILEVADGTMVARGDLGVELPLERVPIVQKQIIRATVRSGKPAITATQMLDSMERNPRPTRAEVSDVANAIFDGTSAIMLSGETATGRYPVESVATMARLALEAEGALHEYGDLQQARPSTEPSITEGVAQAATTLAQELEASAILTLTESGTTSRAISKHRPPCPILAVTTRPELVRRLALNWGVTGLLFEDSAGDEEKVAFGIERARALCSEPGDVVVVTAGISQETGSTNLVRVVTV